jgi:hypothetical protein
VARIAAVALALLLAACAGTNVRMPEEARQEKWLVIQRTARLPNGGTSVVVACDAPTGNLLYILGPSSDGKGFAVVVGGCK